MTLVFVYGTLRRGQGNDRLLHRSEFVGEAVSIDKGFILRGRGPVPYLSHMEGTPRSGSIKGEVWDVPDEDIPSLDRLEGHPNWYRREQHDFKLGYLEGAGEGPVVKAWVYLIPWKEQMAHEINTFHTPGEGGVLEHPKWN